MFWKCLSWIISLQTIGKWGLYKIIKECPVVLFSLNPRRVIQVTGIEMNYNVPSMIYWVSFFKGPNLYSQIQAHIFICVLPLISSPPIISGKCLNFRRIIVVCFSCSIYESKAPSSTRTVANNSTRCMRWQLNAFRLRRAKNESRSMYEQICSCFRTLCTGRVYSSLSEKQFL